MLFSEIDEDGSGVITYQMFEKGIRSQDVKMLGRCDSASVNPVVQHLSTSLHLVRFVSSKLVGGHSESCARTNKDDG